MRRTRGFTLIELLVAVTILGILMAVALPSFTNAYLTNRLASYSNNFVSSVQFARSEAVKRNVKVTVCPSSDGATCITSPSSWQPGWIVKCQATSTTATACSADSTATSVLVLQKQGALDSSYSMTSTSGGYAVDLSPSGVGSSDYTIKLCRSNGEQWREIKVTATGRASVSSRTNCS